MQPERARHPWSKDGFDIAAAYGTMGGSPMGGMGSMGSMGGMGGLLGIRTGMPRLPSFKVNVNDLFSSYSKFHYKRHSLAICFNYVFVITCI